MLFLVWREEMFDFCGGSCTSLSNWVKIDLGGDTIYVNSLRPQYATWFEPNDNPLLYEYEYNMCNAAIDPEIRPNYVARRQIVSLVVVRWFQAAKIPVECVMNLLKDGYISSILYSSQCTRVQRFCSHDHRQMIRDHVCWTTTTREWDLYSVG